MSAVATTVPAFMLIGSCLLLAIMISVWPSVESWFKVGTTSRELASVGGTGFSSARHGSMSFGAVLVWNMILVLVLLCGSRVSVFKMVKVIWFNGDCSV